jgi:hypothetical protein
VGGGVSILFRHVIVVAVLRMVLVEFPGPVATLLLNQKRKRSRPQIILLRLLGNQVRLIIAKKRIKFQASSAARRTNSYLQKLYNYKIFSWASFLRLISLKNSNFK